MIAPSETGQYHQADTVLHRLDPRLKVFICLLLVVLSFTAAGWGQLFTVFSTVVVAAWSVRPFSRQILRFFWMLRWLLLLTLLMHLLFSSGRTLWGFRWLSYDGLLSGTFVCLQMLLAITASALMGITTTAESLARAFGWYVKPLDLLGCRSAEWQKLLLLALNFVPLVQAEVRASGQIVNRSSEALALSMQGRCDAWGKRVHGLILRLIDRGDEIAHRLAVEDAGLQQQFLPAFLPMALLDQLFAVLVCLVLVAFWLMG